MDENLFDKNGRDPAPSYRLEQGMGGPVAGVDEAGRGPWAGPVVAAAVILDPADIPAGLNDSKKLSATQRAALFDEIMNRAAAVALGMASVAEIDHLNILRASLLAMKRAVEKVSPKPAFCLIDGRDVPPITIPARAVIRGDGISLSIAAASIIAKVTRDRLMAALAEKYPAYDWHKNAGYGVPAHRKALELVGVSPHHRKSFAPIRNILTQDS